MTESLDRAGVLGEEEERGLLPGDWREEAGGGVQGLCILGLELLAREVTRTRAALADPSARSRAVSPAQLTR